MIKRLVSTSAIATALAVMPSSLALAQSDEVDSRNPASNEMADECIIAMNDFAQRMYQDDFWMSGWGDSGYAAPPAPQSTAAENMPNQPSATSPSVTGVDRAETASAVDPRQRMAGIDAPRYQIRTLYNAGRVLAHRGDRDGCDYIVAKMQEVYDGYAQQLEEAGVDPNEISSWRQEQLALAQPLSESDTLASYRIDTLTGTDVRNLNDELLGSVSDVIINPENGETTHLIVARGGFLGIGEDHYAIPWDEVRATPGLETFVVEMAEAEMENAPSVDRSRFGDPEAGMEDRERTDQFWTQRG
jgi:sporulation protein YlmC with PRC-barrel domain